MPIKLPTEPLYTNAAGLKIFWIGGAAHGTRTAADIRLLCIHHTAGTDSRRYLAHNPLKSSSTYLVGKYPDCGLRIYKFMSEASHVPYTQGYGVISNLDVNKASISIETEGPPFDPQVVDATAKLAASILRYWAEQGRELLMLGHLHVDPRKQDPALPWGAFCKQVYGYL